MKIKDSFKYGSRYNIEYILTKILNKDKMFLYLNEDFEFDETYFLEIIEKIEKNYPIEYIFEEVYFYSQKFYIKEKVLIPRDDTEILIDIAKEELKKFKEKIKIAEIGVGSGVISITLSKLFPNFSFIGSDINPVAIEIAEKNSKLHNQNIKFYLTNLLDNIDEKIDVIISNPPYVEKSWQNEKLKYEPKEAIFADDNGTSILKQIVKLAIEKKVKLLICEMGYNQKRIMSSFFETYNIQNYYFYKDLNNNDRGFVLKF